MGLYKRTEKEGLVYEIYFQHLYWDKWVSSGVSVKECLERGISLLFDFRVIDNKIYRQEKHPYATKCKIIIYDKNTNVPRVELEAKTTCHPKDQFSRKKGRELSFNKVVQQIDNLEYICYCILYDFRNSSRNFLNR